MAFNRENYTDTDEPAKEGNEWSPPPQRRIYQSSMNSKTRDRNDKNDNSWLIDIRNERDWNQFIDSKAIFSNAKHPLTVNCLGEPRLNNRGDLL